MRLLAGLNSKSKIVLARIVSERKKKKRGKDFPDLVPPGRKKTI